MLRLLHHRDRAGSIWLERAALTAVGLSALRLATLTAICLRILRCAFDLAALTAVGLALWA